MAVLLHSTFKSSVLLQPFASAVQIALPTANQKQSVQLLQQLQCFPEEVWPLEK